MDLYHQIHHLPYQQMVGIHTIKDFHSAKDPGNSGAYAWKKIAVDPFDAVKIQWANDSCAYFSLKVDSTKKTMELEAWNDSSSKAFLHYKQTGVTEWSFEGMYKTDSIHFATDYSNIHSLPLLKERGTIHWIYGLK
jgi:hypothetical protein